MVVGFAAMLFSPIQSIPIPTPALSSNSKNVPFTFIRIPIQNPRNPRRFVVFARDEGDNGGNDSPQEDLKRKPSIFNLNWKDLLDPNPENIVAVGLTGLLTWASVQVLWQLLFISVAILVAALKYSFIAALLLFILITLL